MMDLETKNCYSTSSLSNMSNLAECAVCHQAIPKGRVHYGGVSCYSCRAFFRRNTQRDELPTCKTGQQCRVTHLDRKQCSACRYQKCITIGMRPDLVLDATGKQERFKKYLRKKDEERMKADQDQEVEHKAMPPLQPIPGLGFPINALLLNSHLQKARTSYRHLPFPFPDPPHFPASSQRPPAQLYPSFPPFSLAPKLSPRPLPLAAPPLAPVDLRNHMSSRHSGVSTSSSSSEMDYSSGPSFPTYTSAPLPLLERTSVISIPSQYRAEGETSLHKEPESSSEEEGATSSKRQYWSSPLPLQVQIKEEVDTEDSQEEVTEDSLLEKYIHKKFSKSKTFSSDLRPSEFENRKRQSVIVQAPASSAKRQSCLDLRNVRISKPDRTSSTLEDEPSWQEELEAREAPVDLSSPGPRAITSPASLPSLSPRRDWGSESTLLPSSESTLLQSSESTLLRPHPQPHSD